MGDFNYIGAVAAEIGLYRSSAVSTGGDGSYVVLPWDAETTNPAKIGFTHSTSVSPENITCNVTGTYLLTGAIKLGPGVWDELRASIEVNGVAKYTPNCGAASGLLNLVSNTNTLILCKVLRLAEGDVVRVRIASVGEATVALDVGETDTWLELRQL